MTQANKIKTQSATFAPTKQKPKIAQNRKEKHFYQQFTGVTRDFRETVVLRLYGTNKIYACLWVNDSRRNLYVMGGGNASGYGYHKASAAAQEAFDDAGIKLALPIDGRGNDAIEPALKAVMAALGYEDFAILNAHA